MVYRSIGLTNTKNYDPHHSHGIEQAHHIKLSPVHPILINHCLYSLSLAMLTWFQSHVFSTSRLPNKQNHTVFSLSVGILALTNMYVIACINCQFLFIAKKELFQYMDVPQFTHSMVKGHLCCFQILFIIYKAVINI